jgi:hypothetical protein
MDAEIPRVASLGGLFAHVKAASEQAAIAADAQIKIWELKILRMIVIGAVLLPLFLAAVALLVYGFVLLDRSVAYALSDPQYPIWLSSAARGALYMGIPLIAVIKVWISHVHISKE